MNRRFFLKSTGLALAGTALVPRVFVRMAEAGTMAGRKTIVAIFQRGAVDGLNMIIPYGEKGYYSSRPNIAVARPGQKDGAIDLDGFFALHPAMSPIAPLFKERSLAVVHAVGSPDPTRSHFDAQDFMESGTPGVKSTRDGFLARALGASPASSPTPTRAVAITQQMPRILSGTAEATAVANVGDFGVKRESQSFEQMYASAVDESLSATARDTFEAARVLRSAVASSAPQNGARYPRGPLAESLRQIAQLIRAGVGLEIAFAEVSGWDTHAGQGGAQGQLANQLRLMSEAIAAFTKDLGSKMSDVTLVTMSEFGRTVRENGNRGTDHGHANVMLLLGGGVRGGKVHGQWPGLDRDQLHEGRDLAVTTDFRDIFAEVLSKRMGVKSLDRVFPSYRPKIRGVLA